MNIVSSQKSPLDLVIEKGVLFLLIFTPLAFGTVQDWSVAVMEIASFVVFCAWLLRMMRQEDIATAGTPMLYFLGCAALIALFQLVPLPSGMLSLLSPGTKALHDLMLGRQDGAWRPISVHPDATWEELYKLLAYIAVFIVIINHYRTREQVRGVVWTIVIMGSVLAVFAVVQKMTWSGRLFWLYPVSESVSPVGPYINRNHFAGYMEMAIPLGLGLILYKASRLRLPERVPPAKKMIAVIGSDAFPLLMASFLAVLVMAGALFMSLSRGGMLGFAASMAFFLWITRARRSLRKRTMAVAMTGLAVFVIVVLAGWGTIEDRFQELGGERKIERFRLWSDSAGIVRDYPLWGTGFGTFGDAYLHYQSISPLNLFDRAHNDYLEILTDLGLAGFAAFAGFAYLYWTSVLKAWRGRGSRFVTSLAAGGLASCVALGVHSLVDFNLRIPANALLLTVIAAVSYAAVFNVHGERNGG